MFSLRDYIKVLDRMKKVVEDLLDIDKESVDSYPVWKRRKNRKPMR